MLGGALADHFQVVEVTIERDAGFDGLHDDGVADLIANAEAHENGVGARGGDFGFEKPLKADEFAHGGVAADEAFEEAGLAGVELEDVRNAGDFEAPDLALGAVFDESAGLLEGF